MSHTLAHTPTDGSTWPATDPVLRAALERSGGARPREVVELDAHSNYVAEVRMEDGRALIVKRARHYPEMAARRFGTARRMARLLRERAGVVAPEHLDLPEGIPAEAYWRIPHPTLKELWPGMSRERREEALRSWGVLLRRIHSVRLVGVGEPVGTGHALRATAERLRADLEERLLPSLRYGWPAAERTAEHLLRITPRLEKRLGSAGGVLVHGDLHMGNVLCRDDGEGVRCVGVLDLEEACMGPPEADWAALQLLHGPLFGQPLSGDWLQQLAAGYRREMDPVLLAFFRAHRLLNIGFHAAVTGLEEHAEQVASAAASEMDLLEALRRPRVRIGARA